LNDGAGKGARQHHDRDDDQICFCELNYRF